MPDATRQAPIVGVYQSLRTIQPESVIRIYVKIDIKNYLTSPNDRFGFKQFQIECRLSDPEVIFFVFGREFMPRT